jgi:hypothetical protein
VTFPVSNEPLDGDNEAISPDNVPFSVFTEALFRPKPGVAGEGPATPGRLGKARSASGRRKPRRRKEFKGRASPHLQSGRMSCAVVSPVIP